CARKGYSYYYAMDYW
nr:immunoglobulin heavy chain junction region [Mus musculus]